MRSKRDSAHFLDPVELVHEYGYMPDSNHIFMFPWTGMADREYEEETGIEWTMANRVIANLQLHMQDWAYNDRPLIVHMKSQGGDWNEGMAIFDAFLSFPKELVILNYTHARSMTSMIFQAATKRVMMPNSYFMIHDGEYGNMGTVKQVASDMEFYKRSGETMMNIYVRRLKQRGRFNRRSQQFIRDMLRELMDKKEDVYLTAREAVDWGFADEIFDGDWDRLNSVSSDQIERINDFAGRFLG